MRYADAIAALVEGGWTRTHYDDWKGARDHRYDSVSMRHGQAVVYPSSLGWALHAKRVHRYDRVRGSSTISWADHAVSADVWVSTPTERGDQVVIAMVFDATGKVIRQMHVQSGWKPYPATNEDVARTARRESPQGRERARLESLIAEQEREERIARRMEDRERLERLADDAREMLEEQGYDPTIISVTPMGKVTIDLEDFLSILRSDAGG
jgi:hypothetical protein